MKLCKCGCGKPTKPARDTRPEYGQVRGIPVDYIKGHNMKTKPEYLIEDRGFKTKCWIWNRAVYRYGYGQARVGDKVTGAHRAIWMRLKGPIPKGATLDHLCPNPLCVNPKHMQIVAGDVNSYRGGKRAHGKCCKECGRPF
jgi:hypothetical protein